MIKVSNLVKTYKSKSGVVTTALKNFSYTFPETGLIFVVGKSGSGKSTLLNILGLLDNYDSGDLFIDGKSTKDFSQNERDGWRALNIGFVFQEFHIIEKYSIGQNISLPLEIQHNKPTKEQVAEALRKVDLENFEKRKSKELSGGQRQRVAIARALIKDPAVILADEPTGNLDSQNSKTIFNLLKRLSKTKLVIIISHDIENANKYADEIIDLKDGEIFDIRKGNEFYDTVEISTDKTNKKEIDELLKSGKRVILTPPKKKETKKLYPSAKAIRCNLAKS